MKSKRPFPLSSRPLIALLSLLVPLLFLWQLLSVPSVAAQICQNTQINGLANLHRVEDGQVLCLPANTATLPESNGFSMSHQPVWESLFADKTTSLAWGDVDNDGDLDLAVGNSNFIGTNPQEPELDDADKGQGNRLYLNINGQLDPTPVWSGSPDSTLSLAWGDVNGDGYLDLAVGNIEQDKVYLNHGGRLSASPDWLAADTGPEASWTTSIAWGDLNGDGALDLLAQKGFDSGTIYLNQTLLGSDDKAVPIFSVGISLEDGIIDESTLALLRNDDHEAWGDINNDQQLDRIRANFGIGLDLETEPFISDAFFGTPLAPTITLPTVVALGDATGNGALELAVGEYQGEIKLFRLTGTDPATELIWQSEGQGGVEALAWGDSDGDGDLDLAVGGPNKPVRLYLNESNPYAIAASSAQIDSLDSSYLAIWGDSDNDGFYDLLQAANKIPLQILQNGYGNTPATPWQPNNATTQTINDIRDAAWGYIDNDQYLDLVIANYFAPNQLFHLTPEGKLLRDDTWTITDTEATTAVSWGDVDGDGDLDLAVGNRSSRSIPKSGDLPSSLGNDQLFLNNGGQIASQPSWQAADTEATLDINWWDYDADGDLDLIAATDQQPNSDRLYLNDGGVLQKQAIFIHHQTRWEGVDLLDVNGDGRSDFLQDGTLFLHNHAPIHPQFVNQPALNIALLQPASVAPATTAAQGSYDEDGFVSFTYQISGPNQQKFDVLGFFSLDGGDTWQAAEPTADSNTQNLTAGQENYTYTWDIFKSGVFGSSDDVRFRLQVRPRVQPQPNAVPGFYQRPFAQTETLPFRVRGTQVQVFEESGDTASGAVVYRQPANEPTAVIMGSSVTNLPFETNENGFLNGRGELTTGDQMMAMLPVTQTYRLPPQLYFSDENGRLQTTLTQPPTTTLTAEFWVQPLSYSGNLLTMGDDIALTYQTVTETAVITTTLSLSIADETITTTVSPFLNGEFHQLAFSWDSNLDANNTLIYLNGQPMITTTLAVGQAFTDTASLILGEQFVGAMDEIRLWQTVRTPEQIEAENGRYQQGLADFWPTRITDTGALLPSQTPDLLGYWPITAEETTVLADLSGQANDALVGGNISVAFKPHYTAYHTSAKITDTVAFQPVSAAGVQTLVVSADNPLLLFDLDVSLEWDPSDESAFLSEIEASFARASELLYDVTNGQAALHQINFFFNKTYWGQADVVIYADNSLRPSATIGGVVNRPISETVYNPTTGNYDKDVPDAYVPGHIRMGTVWDPFGESTADLGEEWSRALAHELSHYLLFLPDNYLGFDGDVLRLIDSCTGSFMGDNIDPADSEFLLENDWSPRCDPTLANRTTGRSDWETITRYYPMLNADETYEGPGVLPLDFMLPVAWMPVADEDVEERPLLSSRNFTLQTISDNAGEERARLPNAQGFLIKTQGNNDPSDDLIINLGTPTGGGNRLKVRGATEGDRLCLFGSADTTASRYAGCDTLDRTDASLLMTRYDDAWSPQVNVDSVNGQTISITVQLTTALSKDLNVQIYPLHYPSISGLAPTAMLHTDDGLTFTRLITLPLPAYEVAARVWVQGEEGERETVTFLRLNPTEWGDVTVPISLTFAAAPQSFTGNPIARPTGDPIARPTGDPIARPTGDPIARPTGDPIARPTGDPIARPTGDPIARPTGDPIARPTGDTAASFAPIRSADAQVVVYNTNGFFEDNGILGLQTLSQPPRLPSWLIPVGQAYHVISDQVMTDTRIISFNYLQRNVPAGYEDTLSIYFLPDCPNSQSDCIPQWQPIASTQRFIENMIVAPLITRTISSSTEKAGTALNGVYAVMSTIALPPLQPEWNLFSYPLLISRTVTEALNPIEGNYDEIFEVQMAADVSEVIVRQHISSLNIRSGPGTNYEVVGYLRRNEGAAVIEQVGEWFHITCPPFVAANAVCWVTAHPAFVRLDESPSAALPTALTPSSGNLKRPTEFQPNRVYWIRITSPEPVTLYLAPPIRQVDGELK